MEDGDKKIEYLPARVVYSGFLLIILLFALYLGFVVLSPFLDTIIFAIVLSALFYPLYIYFFNKFRGRSICSALTVLIIIFFGLFIPVFIFFSGLVAQGADSLSALNNWVNTVDIQDLLAKYSMDDKVAWLQKELPFIDWEKIDLQSSLLKASQGMGQILLQWGRGILGDIASVTMNFMLMLFIMFYFFVDGARMMRGFKYLCPLRDEQEESILANLREVARSVFAGGMLIALLQGIAGGLALWIVGIPALFWGTMMGFASLVPVVGTALVWIPAEIYLLLGAKWGLAIFFALWCILVVGSIDNFVRPILMRGSSGMSTLYLFLSIMGGVQIFGMKGLLYGPLAISFAVVMLKIYGEEYREVLNDHN